MTDPYFEIDGTSISTSATSIKVDTIAEKTANAGVYIDGINMKDSVVSTDTINEKTVATGVTIDGLLIKDGKAAALSSKVGTFTRAQNGADGAVAYTGVGFTLKTIKFIFCVDGIVGGGIGFSDGTSNYTVTEATTGVRKIYATKCIALLDNGSWDEAASVTAIGSDGFTLTWVKGGTPPAGTITVYYEALG